LNPTPSIYGLGFEELEGLIDAWDEPPYRARQIWHALYVEQVESAGEITTLPLELRSHLAQEYRFRSLAERRKLISNDGRTEKFLFSLVDGKAIEVVLMRYHRRRTACISTQVGCAMGCSFCATGRMGFGRHLSAGEIIEQVLYVSRYLTGQEDRLTNVVVMGMGEPFHNYDATVEAIGRLGDHRGFNFGARRFTVSTVGLVPMIERFGEELGQVNLAVSLHAATDALRDELLPINRKYPLGVLIAACREHVRRTSRRITFEWALINGVNDGPEQAHALCRLVEGLDCHVNLIPLNPIHGYSGTASPEPRVAAFQQILQSCGIPTTVRVRRGIEIDAGCGQLATNSA
jgi:23S rRNA (adenine2503-C2)-methyltransferase